MKLQPKNNYLIVKAVEPKKATASGLVLPEGAELDADHQTSYGEVVATTSGSEYNAGDTVLFSKLVPDDVMVEDTKGKKLTYWFVLESDIKAVVT